MLVFQKSNILERMEFDKSHSINHLPWQFLGFPGGSVSKESACNAGVLGLIPELGRSPGEENDYPLQFSCLENSMDRGAWQATVIAVTVGHYRATCTFTFHGSSQIFNPKTLFCS